MATLVLQEFELSSTLHYLLMVSALFAGVIAGFIASLQKRNPIAWIAIGAMMPLVAFVLLKVLPDETDSSLSALERLQALQSEGAITADEFEHTKKTLLGRIQ